MKKGSANHAISANADANANAATSVNTAASAKALGTASCDKAAANTTCDKAAAGDHSTFATVCANPTTEPGLYAAIDCGTVTVRMLVARIETSQHLRVLHRAYAIVNVGERVDATRRISSGALQRLSATLHDFRTHLSAYEQQEHEHARVRACATSAARDASNKDDLHRVFREAGFELDIISGDEEAHLSFAGACAGWQALCASPAKMQSASSDGLHAAPAQTEQAAHSKTTNGAPTAQTAPAPALAASEQTVQVTTAPTPHLAPTKAQPASSSVPHATFAQTAETAPAPALAASERTVQASPTPTYPAASHAVVAQQALLVVDIGGGSTELIAGIPGSAPCYVHSFDIGCRRATEKVLGSERISLASLERLNAWIDELMSPYFEQLYRDERFYGAACDQERLAHAHVPVPEFVSASTIQAATSDIPVSESVSAPAPAPAPAALPDAAAPASALSAPNAHQHPFPRFPLLGVAGAATSAVSMLCSMHHYDAARVHGFPVSEANVAALIHELSNMTLEQRKQRVGLEPKRASVIVAGLAIMQRIMYHTHHACYYACESDVLQGVIFTLASNSCRYNRNCLVQ